MRWAVVFLTLVVLAGLSPLGVRANPGLAYDLHPLYVPKDGTPFAIQVSIDGLAPSSLYDVRAGLRNWDSSGSMRVVSHYWSWEFSEWRRSDWGSAYFRSDGAGRWTGRILLRANLSSTYYDDAIRGNTTAYISVDYRQSGGSYVGWLDTPVLLLDMDATTSGGTPGGWIHGYVMDGGTPVENATVVVNDSASGLVFGVYATQPTGAQDYPLPATEGYYRVAVPEGGPYDLTVLSGGMAVSQAGGIAVSPSLQTHASINADPSPGESSALMVELYPDTSLDESSSVRQLYGVDEYVRILNPSSAAVDMGLWSITDGVGAVYFPNGTVLPPARSLYVASNATAFLGTMGFPPDFEYEVDGSPATPDMIREEKVPWFLNGGDAVQLRHRRHTFIIDVLVYGDAAYAGGGWSGPGAPLPGTTYILRRYPDEATGLRPDTDTAEDWISLHRPRAGQSETDEATVTFAGSVTAFVSPDSSFQVIASTLENATVNVSASLYQIESPYLAGALANASTRGVEVRLLLEGGPVQGITMQQRAVSKLMADAGVEIRFMVHDMANHTHNRYNFLHAKYAVIDGLTSIIGTENWKPTGTPANPSYGNRGWGVALESQALAYRYLGVFEDDWSGLHRDIFPYSDSHPVYGGADPAAVDWSVPDGGYSPSHGALTVSGTFTATTLIAPDTSLSTLGGVMGLVDSAASTLDIAQFYVHDRWRDSRTGEDAPNGYLEAAIDAARRGVKVRILMDSFWYNVDESDPVNNVATADYVNAVAAAENLDLEARLVDLPAAGFVKLHAKGVIVDGSKTAVSSINWNRHSPTYNREVGVILESPEVAAYFTQVFQGDWGEALADWRQEVVLVAAEHALQVPVGGERTTELTVTNVGTVGVEVDITLSPPSDWWTAVQSQDTLVLAPGASGTVEVTLSAAASGTFDLTATASVTNSSVSDNDTISVEAAVMALEVTAPAEPVVFEAGGEALVPVRIRNGGTVAINVSFALSALPAGWQALPDARSLLLLPGEEVNVSVSVNATAAGSVELTVSAMVPNTSVSDSAIVVLRAVAPPGADLWWLLLLALVIVVAILAYAYWRRRRRR